MQKSYHITVTVKNGYLKSLMEREGFQSGLSLARASGANYSVVIEYLNLTCVGIRKNGEWSKSALRLANTLKCLPEDMFPPEHIKEPLAKNKSSSYMNAKDFDAIGYSLRQRALPVDEVVSEKQTISALHSALEGLTIREKDVLTRRYGLETGEVETLDNVSKLYKVQKERIRQIEAKALRKLKYSSVGEQLRAAIGLEESDGA